MLRVLACASQCLCMRSLARCQEVHCLLLARQFVRLAVACGGFLLLQRGHQGVLPDDLTLAQARSRRASWLPIVGSWPLSAGVRWLLDLRREHGLLHDATSGALCVRRRVRCDLVVAPDDGASLPVCLGPTSSVWVVERSLGGGALQLRARVSMARRGRLPRRRGGRLGRACG